jgi:hypothetical protein
MEEAPSIHTEGVKGGLHVYVPQGSLGRLEALFFNWLESMAEKCT